MNTKLNVKREGGPSKLICLRYPKAGFGLKQQNKSFNDICVTFS